MAFTPRTEEELKEQGYEPINAVDAGRLRSLGVPLVQRGLVLEMAGSRFKFWAPRWAKILQAEWPLNQVQDYDQFRMKQVIRYIARTGKTDMVDAFLSVARLGGERAVEKMLDGDEGDETCG